MPLLYHHIDGDYEVQLHLSSDGSYDLSWHDHMANGWEEAYTDLALALARLAVLERAVRTDAAFVHGEAAFATAARTFFDAELGVS